VWLSTPQFRGDSAVTKGDESQQGAPGRLPMGEHDEMR